MPCKDSSHNGQAVISVILSLRQRSYEHQVCWSVRGVSTGKERRRKRRGKGSEVKGSEVKGREGK